MQHQETAQSKKQSNKEQRKGNFSHWDKFIREAQELDCEPLFQGSSGTATRQHTGADVRYVHLPVGFEYSCSGFKEEAVHISSFYNQKS